jgi:hypothetical protein
MKNLLENWDKPLNIININDIENIVLYAIFLIYSLDIKGQENKVINFFFNDFIFLINPEYKKKF